MVEKEKLREVLAAKSAYEAALSRGMGIDSSRAKYIESVRKNVDALFGLLTEIRDLREENKTLNAAIEQQDKELDELRKAAKSAKRNKQEE